MCLSLLIFPCTIKSRNSLLALAHPGGPGKRAIIWLWCVGGGRFIQKSVSVSVWVFLNIAISISVSVFSTRTPSVFLLVSCPYWGNLRYTCDVITVSPNVQQFETGSCLWWDAVWGWNWFGIISKGQYSAINIAVTIGIVSLSPLLD